MGFVNPLYAAICEIGYTQYKMNAIVVSIRIMTVQSLFPRFNTIQFSDGELWAYMKMILENIHDVSVLITCFQFGADLIMLIATIKIPV